MSNGTMLNDIYVPRIHKSNAEDIRDEARDMLVYYRDRMMIIAAMTPPVVDEGYGPIAWPDYVRREVDEIIDGMENEWFREFAANHIVDHGPKCKDELCPDDWPETEGTKEGKL